MNAGKADSSQGLGRKPDKRVGRKWGGGLERVETSGFCQTLGKMVTEDILL